MSNLELGQVGQGKYPLTTNPKERRFNSQCFLLFSVLTSVDASVKLYVKIIVVKVVISVLLKWSRINPKLVVTLDGELCGNQYDRRL